MLALCQPVPVLCQIELSRAGTVPNGAESCQFCDKPCHNAKYKYTFRTHFTKIMQIIRKSTPDSKEDGFNVEFAQLFSRFT